MWFDRDESYEEHRQKMLDALQEGIEKGRRIREARERGASREEVARLEYETFGFTLDDEDFDADPAEFVYSAPVRASSGGLPQGSRGADRKRSAGGKSSSFVPVVIKGGKREEPRAGKTTSTRR